MDPEEPEEATPRLAANHREMIRTMWTICGLALGAWSLLYLALTALMGSASGPSPAG